MTGDQDVLLHCIHNALWMAEHETAVKSADEHVAVLSPAQKFRAAEMLAEIMRAGGR